MKNLLGLRCLFVTVFLYSFSMFMGLPAIPDVTLSALCPGKDKCSLAIYLTGFQQWVYIYFLYNLSFAFFHFSYFLFNSTPTMTIASLFLSYYCF